jgi:hypothetical protein
VAIPQNVKPASIGLRLSAYVETGFYFILPGATFVPPWSLPGPEPPWPDASGFTILPLAMPSLLMPVVPLVIELKPIQVGSVSPLKWRARSL